MKVLHAGVVTPMISWENVGIIGDLQALRRMGGEACIGGEACMGGVACLCRFSCVVGYLEVVTSS